MLSKARTVTQLMRTDRYLSHMMGGCDALVSAQDNIHVEVPLSDMPGTTNVPVEVDIAADFKEHIEDVQMLVRERIEDLRGFFVSLIIKTLGWDTVVESEVFDNDLTMEVMDDASTRLKFTIPASVIEWIVLQAECILLNEMLADQDPKKVSRFVKVSSMSNAGLINYKSLEEFKGNLFTIEYDNGYDYFDRPEFFLKSSE